MRKVTIFQRINPWLPDLGRKTLLGYFYTALQIAIKSARNQCSGITTILEV